MRVAVSPDASIWDGAFAVRLALFGTGAFWAVQLWRPVETLAGSPSYRWMREVAAHLGFAHAPDVPWAVVFTAEAIVCGAAIVWRNTPVRFLSALAVGVVRGAVAWGIWTSNPGNGGWGVYTILALLAYWLAARNVAVGCGRGGDHGASDGRHPVPRGSA